MPKHGACNLGSINLSEFVDSPFMETATFNYKEFKKAVAIAIKGLDQVLDEGIKLHALQEQRKMAKNYRNIGLGIMGLGDMFIKLGLKYGSKKSQAILDKIMNVMFRTSVFTSNELATNSEVFPKYSDKVFDSQIIKRHFSKEEITKLKQYGLRNCSLLSIAPSGSIGTMLDITTGIEPAFQFSYKRKTESLHKDKEVYYDVLLGSAVEYSERFNTKTLPEYFVTSSEIHWIDRIDIQAMAQKHIDTAISSTINLPKEITLEEIEQLYLYAWSQGLKGITIYRDGCKRGAILSSNDTTEETKDGLNTNELPWGTTIEVDDDLIGKKRKIITGCGSLHVQAWFDKINGNLMEVYLAKGSEGGCNSWMITGSRLLSFALRTGASFDGVIDQLKSAPSCSSYLVRAKTKHDTSKGKCCGDAVANALVEMRKEIIDELGLEEDLFEMSVAPPIKIKSNPEPQLVDDSKKNPCPDCGEELIFEGGCNICHHCGFSKCD